MIANSLSGFLKYLLTIHWSNVALHLLPLAVFQRLPYLVTPYGRIVTGV